MARPGPKPKPTQMKLIAGNPGRRPLNDSEPEPPAPARPPYAPRHLPEDAKREWRRMAKLLHASGVLTEVDTAGLEAYCWRYQMWVDAVAEVAADGPLTKTVDGNLIQHPYLAVANRAEKEMRAWMAEFGCTPSSRSRVKVPRESPADELRRLLRGSADGS